MAKLKQRIDGEFCNIRYYSGYGLMNTIIEGKFLIEIHFDCELQSLTIPYWGKVHIELIEDHITEFFSRQLKKELCIES